MRPNPWLSRYEGLEAPQTIERFRHQPAPLNLASINDKSDLLAQLREKFVALAVPTKQIAAICEAIIDLCKVHAHQTYKDPTDFLRACYDKNGPTMPQDVFPHCLTGPAGIGKSTLLSRLMCLLPQATTLAIDNGHRVFPLNAAWYLSVKHCRTTTAMLKHLITSNGGTPCGKNVDDLIAQCRRMAYQAGVCLLCVDELQFLTKSAQANTRIVTTLFDLMEIGLPMVYVANYSLGHRLNSRPEEDRQRLTVDPYILLPDPESSEDWKATLNGFINIAPELFKIDADMDAAIIHAWTAGTKRHVATLMYSAVRRQKRSKLSVTVRDLEKVYESAEYSSNRKDVQAMNLQFATGQKIRKDLTCPFDLPPQELAALKMETDTRNLEDMTKSMLFNSMTPQQRELYDELKEVHSNSKSQSNVVNIGGKPGPDCGDFERGEEILRNLK